MWRMADCQRLAIDRRSRGFMEPMEEEGGGGGIEGPLADLLPGGGVRHIT